MSASQMSDSLTDGDGGAIGQAIGMMTPLSLGIRGSADEMITVIGRNSRFPCEQSVIITPDTSTSSGLTIQVLQGERMRAQDNILIGELALNGQVDEETVLKVTLKIDRSGHLFVTVRDLRADVWQKMKIPNACALPEDQIIRMIEAADNDLQQETSSGSTIDSLKSAVFLPAPTPESLSLQCDQEEDLQEKERGLESLIESLCSEYKQSIDEVIGKKVLADEDLQTLHQTGMGKCLTRFKNMAPNIENSELIEKINYLFEDIRTKNSESREKSEDGVKSLTQRHLKLFEDQMMRTLSQMTVIDEEQINNRFLTVKADMLRKFDVSIKSLDLNPGVKRNVKKNFDQDLEARKVSLVKERRECLEAAKPDVRQILEQYKNSIWSEFNDEPYMNPEQKAVAHQKIISGIDFSLLEESANIELQSKLSHELEAAYDRLQKLKKERETRIEQLVEKLELRYATNMAAIICSPKRRPPTLVKLKVEHEKIVATIFELFMKDPDIIAVRRFRPEFELRLIGKLEERFKGATSEFWVAIGDHVEQLNERAISSYEESLEQEVKQQKPETKDDLLLIHQEIMDQELSRYESDAVISETEYKNQLLERLRLKLETALRGKESKLMREIRHESQKQERLRDAAVQSFVQEMGRYIDHHSEYEDRCAECNRIGAKVLLELKDEGVSREVVESARDLMKKQWMQMRDWRSKAYSFPFVSFLNSR